MGAIIETFHLDVRLILAQLVNFTVVLAVLWFFALRPLTKIMRDRTKTIEDSLQKAEQIEEDWKAAETKRMEFIAQAREESQHILVKAEARAKQVHEALKVKTKEDVEKIVREAKERIESEKQRMKTEIKEELAETVIVAAQALAGKKNILRDVDPRLIEEAIKEVSV